MYCRNCGKEINEGAAICIHCGFAKGKGRVYCPKCGKEIAEGEKGCNACGWRYRPKSPAHTKTEKGFSVQLAGIFGILFGTFGVHNFYMGKTKKGLIQLLISVLSLGTLAIVSACWGAVEGVLLLIKEN